VALAFYRDPLDPKVFSEESLNDPDIRALCRKIKSEVRAETDAANPLASRVTVRLKDGREFAQDVLSYPGLPDQPLNRDQLHAKFSALTSSMPKDIAERTFARLVALESLADMRELIA
jgi:2-methylcitrate dehydratase